MLGLECLDASLSMFICFGLSFWAVVFFDLRRAFLAVVVWLSLSAGGVFGILGFGSHDCWYGYGFEGTNRGYGVGVIVFRDLGIKMKIWNL